MLKPETVVYSAKSDISVHSYTQVPERAPQMGVHGCVNHISSCVYAQGNEVMTSLKTLIAPGTLYLATQPPRLHTS